MEYIVTIKRRVQRRADKMPAMERERLDDLVGDLRESGPIQKQWNNFSDLKDGKYHCHLSYHWAACWRHEAETIEIEVYDVGSREDAPY